MTTSTHLLHRRRFLPLFATQLLGAFNDNLYKNAAVFFVVYGVFNSEKSEAIFSAVASALFIVPFFILSALAGQLADMRDKAQIIRWVKLAEIGIMIAGGAGLVIAWQAKHGMLEPWQDMLLMPVAMPLILLALLGMGIHSTFFGPIKYAILPQHLKSEEVLAGTGLVEAGTYIAILAGTILAGFIPVEWAAAGVFVTALVGYATCLSVPPAPPQEEAQPLDFHILRASVQLVKNTMHDRRVFLAIASISFFWTVGAVLFIEFPLLAKRVLCASKEVASLFLVIFSIGVALGSVSINALLKGKVSARYSPPSVLVMALFVVAFQQVCTRFAPTVDGHLMSIGEFLHHPLTPLLLATLGGIAVAGGMFVVPLYAFLTTIVDKSQTARTIAANNVVNSGAMVVGAAIAVGLGAAGVEIVDLVLISAAMCLISAWLAFLLVRAEREAEIHGGPRPFA
ncbi:MFS transporter [Novosphingobium sediminicola]|uniref:MFS family permease n=1 Tax=Novosphingobium sediminicola TaxID=563162 RepID=A0A7W6CEY5_9SPHN|nr:MFS transporter [Novosphingobium sediminicola]MBB3953434.1 MFS family permease [Novosphingobium sediminicola]